MRKALSSVGILCVLAVIVGVIFIVREESPSMKKESRSLPSVSVREVVIGDRSISMLVVGLPASLREYHFISDPGQPKIVSEWRSELGAEIVFNGSYFNEDGTPSGYWKTGKGKSAVPWPSLEDQADPNGYTFAVTALVDGLHFQYLPANPSEETVDETFLSFPTLVADGKPLVKVDSGLLARRTAVAEDVDGVKYVIVTEKGTLSLYELSRWLVEQPEQFVIAGNLDGGPSTGLSMQSGLSKIEVPSAPISNVIAIWNRE